MTYFDRKLEKQLKDREIEKQVKEAGNRLLNLPSSTDDLLTLPDKVENFLAYVEQEPSKSMIAELDAPYKDEQMKEIFQLIGAAFENMPHVSTHSYNKMDRILAAYRKSSKQWSSTLNKLAQDSLGFRSICYFAKQHLRE
ncbi:hypothetical protein CFP56_015887 [Quercus suber]|uniref:Uncharacterized protein n=1 Tax=Quercus suber TaxID=58331 RepID=A0AAW0M367_QUESU